MALRDRYITLRFQSGLDTETDPKAVSVGKLVTLRNGAFTRNITIEKRYGTVVLPTGRIGNVYSAGSGALGLGSRDAEDELVMLASTDEILAYDDGQGGWVTKGPWTPLQLSTKALPHRPYEQWDPTTASTGRVRIVAWQDARGGLRGQLLDTDGNPYSADFSIDTAGSNATALLIGGRFHVYYVNGSALKVSIISPGSISSPSGTITQIATGLLSPTGSFNTGPGNYPAPYSVRSQTSYAIAAWAFTGSNGSGIKVGCVRNDGLLSTDPSTGSLPAPITYQTASSGPSLAISPDNTKGSVVWAPTGQSGLAYSTFNVSNFAKVTSSVLFDAASEVLGSGLRRLSAAYSPLNLTSVDGTGSLQVAVEVSSSATRVIGLGPAGVTASIPDDHVRLWRIDSGSSTLHVKYGGRLASEIFDVGGRNHVWMTQATPLQSTDYLVRLDDAMTVARSRPGLCVTDFSGTLGNVDVSADGLTFHRAACQREVIPLSNSSGSSYLGRDLVLCMMQYHVSSSWQPQDVGNVLVMPGGWVGSYDGAYVTELGFGQRVEGLVAVPGSGTIPSLYGTGMAISSSLDTVVRGTASYSYVAVPEWYDNRGNRHLGSCMYATTVTLTGAIDGGQNGFPAFYNNSASLAWQSIPHTMKDGANAPSINFAVYRTGPNGTVYQRVDDPRYPIVNTTGSSIVVWYDTIPESVRAQGEVLYTAGEGPNSMPLSPTMVAQGGDCVYLAGLEGEPSTIAVSKLRLGGAVAFVDGDEVAVDARGGPITALSTLDGNVVPFKEARVFTFPAGRSSNSVTDDTPLVGPGFPEDVTSDVGVPEGSFAVHVAGSTVQGLMFRSLRGFRLLDRGLVVRNIGFPIKGFDSLTLTAGLSPRTDEEARFYTAEGDTLVLNTRFDQWGTYDSQPAVAACIWRGKPTYAMADGRVLVEDTGSYTDGGAPISMLLETGWIPLADSLQGLARVRQLFLLGDFWSPHTLRVEVAYDYRDTWYTVRNVDMSGALGVLQYGTGSYGSGSYGGSDPVYQIRVDLPVQRCQTLKVRISDHSVSGQGFSLTEMKVRAAFERSTPRMPTRKIS